MKHPVILITSNSLGKANGNLQLVLCADGQVRVRNVRGMGDILEARMKAEKVITL